MAATALIKLNLKLAAGTESTLDSLLVEVPGVRSAIQTFPDESDEELARLYVLEVNEADSDATLQLLNNRSEIEYVEPAAPRRLIP
ncbi:MAG: hypothetical protein ACKVZH_25995 [Blastocatellia bacterium]